MYSGLAIEGVASVRIGAGSSDAFVAGQFARFQLATLIVGFVDPFFEDGSELFENLLVVFLAGEVANFVRVGIQIEEFFRGHGGRTKGILRGR